MEELCYSSGAATLREPYTYRGEGNAHLALALPASRKILRIKKQEASQPTPDRHEDCEEDWRRDVRFYREIMVPLFAPFADDVHPVDLTPDEIARVQTNLQNIRPAFRRHKKLRCDNAALFTDYAYLPPLLDALGTGHTFSVEIKPKLGFPINGVCLFCEKQRQRFLAGKLDRTSKYCPLLLFSGDVKKMNEAIRGLVETPQNNLQLFKDGVLCYGQDFPIEDFNDAVRELLGSEEDNVYMLHSNFCGVINTILVREFAVDQSCTNCASPERLSVLECVHAVQSFDGLKKLYNADFGGYTYATKYLEDVSDTSNKCPRCVMNGYIEERDESFYGLIEDFIDEKSELIGSIDVWEKEAGDDLVVKGDCGLLREQDYSVTVPHYVSKIARDCSFMITMRKAADLNDDEWVQYKQNTIKTDHGGLIFTIKVFDLYPKIQKKLKTFS